LGAERKASIPTRPLVDHSMRPLRSYLSAPAAPPYLDQHGPWVRWFAARCTPPWPMSKLSTASCLLDSSQFPCARSAQSAACAIPAPWARPPRRPRQLGLPSRTAIPLTPKASECRHEDIQDISLQAVMTCSINISRLSSTQNGEHWCNGIAVHKQRRNTLPCQI